MYIYAWVGMVRVKSDGDQRNGKVTYIETVTFTEAFV